MGCGHLRFQLLHVLAAGPRISKPLDDIVQLGLFLSGPEFGLVVFRGRWVNYPLLPHRTRSGTPNGILRYRICRHVGTWLPLPSWGPPLQCCLLNHAVSFVKWRWNLLRGGCNDKKSGLGYLENQKQMDCEKIGCMMWDVGRKSGAVAMCGPTTVAMS